MSSRKLRLVRHLSAKNKNVTTRFNFGPFAAPETIL